jgi:hypothetical protein
MPPPSAPDRPQKMSPESTRGLAEENCPQCGQPMLRTWGATCGMCRAPLGYARASDVIKTARIGLHSLTLAWVVVIDSPDAHAAGRVVLLEHPINILTRQGASAGIPGEIAFQDDFLSAGHALIRRAAVPGGVSFTVEDRRDPGPSANGTFVNGRRLAPQEVATLCDGDELRIGSTELAFRDLHVPGGRP